MLNGFPPIEEVERQAERLDAFVDMLIKVETDPKRRTALRIVRACREMDLKTTIILKRYEGLRDEKIDLNEAVQTLEYLQLVNAGIDNYLQQIGVKKDGKT